MGFSIGIGMSVAGAGLGSASSGPDPETASAVVAGAGTPSSNGTYRRVGSQNEKAYYLNEDETNEITWDGFQWALNDGNVGTTYVSPDAVDYPWLATWAVEEGDSPAPSVEAAESDPETFDAVVSGAGTATSNGTYNRTGTAGGKARYVLAGSHISWDGGNWRIYDASVGVETNTYQSAEDVAYPWLVTTWLLDAGDSPVPTVTLV